MRNARTIADDLLTELREIGRGGVPDVPPFFANAEWTFAAIVCGDEPWNDVGERMSQEDLAMIIKGLVLLGLGRGGSLGGSVSPVIPLVRWYVRRFPENHERLTGWIVDNTKNHNEPWGRSAVHNARSLRDLNMIEGLERERRAAIEARLAEEALLSKVRKAADATPKLANAVRRGDILAVRALLDRGADWTMALPDHGSLVALAHEHKRTAIAELLESRGIH